MVDASHGNSSKNHANQALVVDDIAVQVAGGERRIFGLMIESNLIEGKQSLVPGQPLTYGQSITDACVSWDVTVALLERLAKAVEARRSLNESVAA